MGTYVQTAPTKDTGESTVADLKLDEFREELKTLMYSCISAVYGERAKDDFNFKRLVTVLDDKHESNGNTDKVGAEQDGAAKGCIPSWNGSQRCSDWRGTERNNLRGKRKKVNASNNKGCLSLIPR